MDQLTYCRHRFPAIVIQNAVWLYCRHRFPAIVIQNAVWLYCRFTLSYLEDLLAERGLDVFYETIRRWVLKFGQIYAKQIGRERPRPTGRWHLDEMVVMIRGKRFYLWRAVDSEGEVLEFLVQSRRNTTRLPEPRDRLE